MFAKFKDKDCKAVQWIGYESGSERHLTASVAFKDRSVLQFTV